jgi:hypothetical protein
MSQRPPELKQTLSTSRLLPAVAASEWRRPAAIFSERPPRSPMKCSRTPSWLRRGTSRSRAPTMMSIRPETSSTGRFQFSDEKAKTVSTPTPRSAQALTQRRSDSTPCL